MNLKKINKVFEMGVRLNIDIFLVYILINFFFLTKIWTDYGQVKILESVLFIFANTSILASTYLLNKISDKEEDTLNLNQVTLNKEKVLVFYIASFTFALLAYFLLKRELTFFLLPLFTFSLLYSYPVKYKLKRFFILKNILPAFSWYLTLILLIKLNIPELLYSQLFTSSFFLFLIFFIFEVFWDLPDRLGDRQTRIYTIPSVLGFRLSKIILLVSLSALLLVSTSFASKFLFLFMIFFIIYSNEDTHKKTFHIMPLLFAFLFLVFSVVNIITN